MSLTLRLLQQQVTKLKKGGNEQTSSNIKISIVVNGGTENMKNYKEKDKREQKKYFKK